MKVDLPTWKINVTSPLAPGLKIVYQLSIQEDPASVVRQAVDQLRKKFKAPLNIDNVENYTLFHKHSGSYLNLLDPWFSEAMKLAPPEFEIALKPDVAALMCFEGLSDLKRRKNEVFQLKDRITDGQFLREFLDLGGIETLFSIIQTADKGLLAYALNALKMAAGFKDVLSRIEENPSFVDHLYDLISTSHVKVVHASLEVLSVFCHYSANGFGCIKRAAKQYAIKHGEERFCLLARTLDTSSDMDTQYNIVVLVNTLLQKAPTKEKQKKVVHELETAGFPKALRTVGSLEDEKMKKQLAELQAQMKVTIPRSWYHVDRLKRELSELTALHEKLEARLMDFENERNANSAMRQELRRLRTPTQRSAAYTGVPEQRTRVTSISRRKFNQGGDGHLLSDISHDQIETQLQAFVFNSFSLLNKDSRRDLFKRLMERFGPQVNVQDRITTFEQHAEAYGARASSVSTVELDKDLFKRGGMSVKEKQKANEEDFDVDEVPEASLDKSKPKGTQPANSVVEKLSKDVLEKLMNLLNAKESPDDSHVVLSKKELDNIVSASEGDEEKSSPSPVEPAATAPPPPPPPPPPAAGAPPPPPPPPPGGAPAPPPPPPPGAAPPAPPGPPPPPGPPGAPPPPGAPSLAPPPPPAIPEGPRPSKKMKQLHWTKLKLTHDTVEKSIWGNMPEVKINLDGVERLFSVKETVKRPTRPTLDSQEKIQKPSSKAAKDGILRVFDNKRSTAIAIMLSRLPPVSIMREAIGELDSTKLDVEELSLLEANLPTAEEYEKVIQLKQSNPNGKFDVPEKFCLSIGRIPAVKSRVRSWMFKLSWDERFESVNQPLLTTRKAISAIRDSDKLRELLAAIRSVGNFMNCGSMRGQAVGFDLEMLPKLVNTKDRDNKMNLLQYILTVVKDEDPSILDVQNDLQRAAPAAVISLDEVLRELQGLRDALRIAKAQKDAVIKAEKSLSSDVFSTQIPRFLNAAEDKIVSTKKLLDETKEELQSLIEFFGYPPAVAAKKDSKNFFSVFREFLQQIQEVISASEREKGRQRHIPEKVVETRTGQDGFQAAVENMVSMASVNNNDQLQQELRKKLLGQRRNMMQNKPETDW